jgi:hypothetical protein
MATGKQERNPAGMSSDNLMNSYFIMVLVINLSRLKVNY